MSFMEFSHFLHQTRAFNVTSPIEARQLEKIFIHCNEERNGDGSNPARALTRAEFFEAIIRIACYKFGKGGAVAAVRKLLGEYILPKVRSLNAGPVRKALKSEEVQQLISDNLTALHHVYQMYAASESEKGKWGTMNLQEFTMVMRDCGLLGDGPDDDDTLTLQEAKLAFSAAQTDEDEAEQSQAGAGANVLEELVFAEFLEGVVRVAMHKWEDPNMPMVNKIQLAIGSVAVLASATAGGAGDHK